MRKGARLMDTENKLWLPPLSPKDQKRLTHLRSDGLLQRIYKRTGFAGKTLWDWLQFLGVLAIPLVVVGATLYFTQQQVLLSDATSKQQHLVDIQLANDQQRETTLKSYLDDMSDLLLNHHLRKAKPEDEVSLVGKERTLTALRRLDASRNRVVLQFLQDAQLIQVTNAAIVIDLFGADLSGDDLRGANLIAADLYRANLRGTDLIGAFLNDAFLIRADLRGADLSGADLSKANLSDADLIRADLSGADLIGADLSGAYLIGADLRGADLSYANLRGAKVTQKQLDGVKSLQGAIMPDGSLHP
jgi:uncharacterized protein YjbI with pentapeptide repeats